jgi:hypothetical protein
MKSQFTNLNIMSQNKITIQCTTKLMMLISTILMAKWIPSLNMNKVFMKKKSQSIFITIKTNKILLLHLPIKSQVFIKSLQLSTMSPTKPQFIRKHPCMNLTRNPLCMKCKKKHQCKKLIRRHQCMK